MNWSPWLSLVSPKVCFPLLSLFGVLVYCHFCLALASWGCTSENWSSTVTFVLNWTNSVITTPSILPPQCCLPDMLQCSVIWKITVAFYSSFFIYVKLYVFIKYKECTVQTYNFDFFSQLLLFLPTFTFALFCSASQSSLICSLRMLYMPGQGLILLLHKSSEA